MKLLDTTVFGDILDELRANPCPVCTLHIGSLP